MLHDKVIKKQLFWTNGCFRATLLEYYDLLLTEKHKRLSLQDLKEYISEDLDKPINTPEINALYLKKVVAMSSKRLSIILEAFQNGQMRRAQETIDAIMTELFERSANPETRSTDESQI
jgi:hypothetical protein